MIFAKREDFKGKLKSIPRYATKHAPVFGDEPFNDNRPPKGVKNSPYYWWFMFLRLNKEYAKTIENGGHGKYKEIYSDFGDVNKCNFKQWWQSKSHLFAEPSIGNQMRIVDSISDIEPLDSRVAVNMVIPLTLSRREIINAFELKIAELYKKGGPIDRLKNTNAKYKLGSRWNTTAMEYAYNIYLEHERTKQAGVKLPWADIAANAKLPFAKGLKKKKNDLEIADKRRNATIQAIRHYKKALKHISAAPTNTFPNLG